MLESKEFVVNALSVVFIILNNKNVFVNLDSSKLIMNVSVEIKNNNIINKRKNVKRYAK